MDSLNERDVQFHSCQSWPVQHTRSASNQKNLEAAMNDCEYRMYAKRMLNVVQLTSATELFVLHRVKDFWILEV